MITERQEKLLDYLIKEYISTTEPVGSFALKTITDLDISAATIRNDLQELTKEGFIEQPHTSAGRVPTRKAYKYFADKISNEREEFFSDFISKEIENARKQIDEEMKLAEELMKSLSETSSMLTISHVNKKDNLFEILTILSSSKTICDKNINVITSIIKQFKNF